MNKLAQESSPYLQQHANNPVDWYPWGDKAIERARSENKPILVSIGYSTCHWCHVMEHESFEDEAVADFMNAHFINIKVDREERPDLDAIYMEAVQILTGSGGWPLNCFLTPDLRPFFGGTYFPPEPRHKRPSWIQVLKNIQRAFHSQPEVVNEQADKLIKYMDRAESQFLGQDMVLPTTDESDPSDTTLYIFRELQERFDQQHGGFGNAPKFPNTMALEYMLSYYHFSNDEEALSLVEKGVEAMIRGGIYDQIGGGFSRYTVDRAWLVPHFEKMLYDNALLLNLIANLHKVSPKEIYRDTIMQTVSFLRREMQAPEGYLYAALDADSEGEEGRYYVWTIDEIGEILGADALIFNKFYGVVDAGNWEGKNILHQPHDIKAFSNEVDIPVKDLKKLLSRSAERLLRVREERVRPGRDEKALLSWNSFMVSALVACYQALNEESIRSFALDLMSSLRKNFYTSDGQTLFHSKQQGKPKGRAFLDGYTSYIMALLHIYQLTWKQQYINEAIELLGSLEGIFGDAGDPFLYFAPKEQADLVVRKKELMDNATPSANSLAARCYFLLSVLTGNEKWSKRAEEMVKNIGGSVARYPLSFSHWAQLLMIMEKGVYEIAVVGPAYKDLADQICRSFLPMPVVVASPDSKKDVPLLEGRGNDGSTLIYLCRNYACQQPVETIDEFRTLLQ